MDIHNRVIAITGAGRGLGRAIALRLASQGAILALVDVNRADLEVTEAEVRSRDGRCALFVCNVADEPEVEATFAAMEEQLGALHGLVNCAGILRDGMLIKVKEGLDPGVLSTIMGKSSGNNWSLERYNPWPGVMENAPASRGYEGGFMTRLMVKDLGLAMALAEHAHSAVPMGALARNLFNLHASQGRESKDFSSILELYLDKSLDKSGAM